MKYVIYSAYYKDDIQNTNWTKVEGKNLEAIKDVPKLFMYLYDYYFTEKYLPK
ncbi:MAG: hypothetical protein K8R54_08975 [Bacteroidales bacterium]|nr:hypothetical protein [Bacteroidales bacterium]